MSSRAQDLNNSPLVNVTATTASEICSRLYLDKTALSLLRRGMSPREFVDALEEKKHYLAAIDFIAHALPSREAIWWGCLSLQRTCGDKLEPWERRAFRIAVQWVLQPNETSRAAAKEPADVLGPASAAGNLAAAANQTGGGAGPPFAPARAVAIAIKVASAKCPPPEIQGTQRALVDLGMAIAEGRFAPRGWQ